ncbi:hypothetical protein GCM10011430_24460 [Oxalicibacterium solurbis]|uniref:Uncharacterized protein n=2 Tax=Oxalicibacterium solurbis TaxID=69280 RepID=A0A8J3B289_9BURK|nr:hypothetical protein GCM10011430_24460 [Oxalicibacterium solurbis]
MAIAVMFTVCELIIARQNNNAKWGFNEIAISTSIFAFGIINTPAAFGSASAKGDRNLEDFPIVRIQESTFSTQWRLFTITDKGAVLINLDPLTDRYFFKVVETTQLSQVSATKEIRD